MKKLFITTTMCLAAFMASAQCRENSAYEVKAENAYTNYNVRYASNPQDAKHYTTDRLRKEFAIEKIFAPGEVNWTYTMFDRSSSVVQSLQQLLSSSHHLLASTQISLQTRSVCSTTVSSVSSTSVVRVL